MPVKRKTLKVSKPLGSAQRGGRDSNPRWTRGPQRFSRPSHSTTLAPPQCGQNYNRKNITRPKRHLRLRASAGESKGRKIIYASTSLSAYFLYFHALMQIGIKDILYVLFLQFLRQYPDRHFFAMHKEYFFDCFLYTYGILYKQILPRMSR
jgi:hypothetical protein